MSFHSQIYGIDFSGSQDAGNKIWITFGQVVNNNLLINDCKPIKELSKSKDLYKSLTFLYDFIAGKKAAFGLDFPFGLSKKLIKESTWQEFVLLFLDKYPEVEDLVSDCKSINESETKRVTDYEAKTPLSPCNLWLYKQTFYGISHLLNPLVYNDIVSVLPMQKAQPNKSWLLEVCPASTLKYEGIYKPYKGNTFERYAAREQILNYFQTQKHITFLDKDLKQKILNNAEGDALDSIIATFATYRALSNEKRLFLTREEYRLEGYVYL